ncbi:MULTISPECIES: ribonuclease Z [Maribacter]|uniref:Ribonuclease Z n=2 Tax=Maribacter TaxID=252356 RepID=A0A5R8M3M9_9FLAO|nr:MULTISPECIES: ribonuclease Z [Maribacter]MDC6406765.1 ribonuclease Z [Maribacter sp. PR66]MEE1973793.1 ribonuclease Z [Maribacter flavus]TLF43039.1 ribonuclease Z [Maribacter aurantiacus]
MIFDKDGTTTLIYQEKKSLSIFLKNLDEKYSEVKNDNLIINLFSFDTLTSGDVMEFLDISNRHRKSGKSFVIVTDKVSYDDVPDEIIVAPTLQEAKDIIEMEEIERDLEL